MVKERPNIKIGNKVRIGKEQNFLTVKDISTQIVKIGPNEVELKRLYFEERHQPEFDWRVKEVK